MMGKCKNCRYGLHSSVTTPGDVPKVEPMVICQLVPPKVMMIADGTIHHRNPWMRPEGWCGQFKLGWRNLLRRSNG